MYIYSFFFLRCYCFVFELFNLVNIRNQFRQQHSEVSWGYGIHGGASLPLDVPVCSTFPGMLYARRCLSRLQGMGTRPSKQEYRSAWIIQTETCVEVNAYSQLHVLLQNLMLATLRTKLYASELYLGRKPADWHIFSAWLLQGHLVQKAHVHGTLLTPRKKER